MNQCRECKSLTIPQPYSHTTVIDGIKVHDRTQLKMQCVGCGASRLTMAQVERYERRAAATVLRTVEKASGKMIRYARRAIGLTQEQLADLLQCASETVSRWENDRATVERHHQLALVALLDTALQYTLASPELLRFMRSDVQVLEVPMPDRDEMMPASIGQWFEATSRTKVTFRYMSGSTLFAGPVHDAPAEVPENISAGQPKIASAA